MALLNVFWKAVSVQEGFCASDKSQLKRGIGTRRFSDLTLLVRLQAVFQNTFNLGAQKHE